MLDLSYFDLWLIGGSIGLLLLLVGVVAGLRKIAIWVPAFAAPLAPLSAPGARFPIAILNLLSWTFIAGLLITVFTMVVNGLISPSCYRELCGY